MSKKSTLSVKTRKTTNGAAGRIFVLDLAGGRVLSANPDGSDLKTILEEGRKLPDGLAPEAVAPHAEKLSAMTLPMPFAPAEIAIR